jgi:hypothetical protein
MTEDEWLACTDPAPMFNLLDRATSERKLRLFACACCRHIWHLLSEAERTVIGSVERHADGLIPAEEMYATAGVNPISGVPNHAPGYLENARRSVLEAASPHAWFRARNARAFVVDAIRVAAGPAERVLEWQRQSDLLRCIFNPFHPVMLDPAWLAWRGGAAGNLARAVYDDRDLPSGHLDAAHLAVLADMLEEAGCADPQLLGHLRGPAPHARGCWVLDLLLQRS